MADEAKPPADVDDAGKSPTAGEQQGKNPDGGSRSEDEPKGRQYTEAYVKQLRSENAELRTRVGEVEERLQEHEDAGKSELEKLTAKASEAEQRAGAAEQRALRYEIAAERGLDLKAAEFLSGTTREEIELRAEELGKLLKDKARPTAAGFDGGARMPAPAKGTPEEEHNRFLLQAMGRERAS